MVQRSLLHALRALPFLLVIATAPAALAGNASLRFDGVDDYVTVPEPVDLHGPLTLEAWVLVGADPAGGRIISNRVGGGGYEMDVVKFDWYYELRLTFNGIAAAYTGFNGHEGTWTHVAATWTGTGDGTIRLYINGVEAGRDTVRDAIEASVGPLRIGAMGTGIYNSSHRIDEVRIWSAALDGATVASWMSRPLAGDHPNYADLEAYWNFDEGSGQVVDNLTGDARRDGELGSSSGEDANDPQWESDGAPVPVDATTIGLIKQRFVRPQE